MKRIAIDAVRPVAEHAALIFDLGAFLDPLPQVPHLVLHDASAIVALAVERNSDRSGSYLLDFADAGDEDLGRIAEVDRFCVFHVSHTPVPAYRTDCGEMKPLWPFAATMRYQSVIIHLVSREFPWAIYLTVGHGHQPLSSRSWLGCCRRSRATSSAAGSLQREWSLGA